MYSNVMVTGGCGFIASNFLNIMKKRYPDTHFINIDKIDYCSNVENVEPGVATFIKGNVGNASKYETPPRIKRLPILCSRSAIEKLPERK